MTNEVELLQTIVLSLDVIKGYIFVLLGGIVAALFFPRLMPVFFLLLIPSFSFAQGMVEYNVNWDQEWEIETQVTTNDMVGILDEWAGTNFSIQYLSSGIGSDIVHAAKADFLVGDQQFISTLGEALNVFSNAMTNALAGSVAATNSITYSPSTGGHVGFGIYWSMIPDGGLSITLPNLVYSCLDMAGALPYVDELSDEFLWNVPDQLVWILVNIRNMFVLFLYVVTGICVRQQVMEMLQ